MLRLRMLGLWMNGGHGQRSRLGLSERRAGGWNVRGRRVVGDVRMVDRQWLYRLEVRKNLTLNRRKGRRANGERLCHP